MAKVVVPGPTPESSEVVELKDPWVAALLAWLIPGLGHLYQGRKAKGWLFFLSIMTIFAWGLVLSDGKAVYASWTEADKRYYYLCQVGVGLPSMPALVQNYLVRSGKAPLLGGFEAPPPTSAELSNWYKRLASYFDLGTVYTTIAGLLNVLVIYDAWGGPAPLEVEEEKRRAAEAAAGSRG